MSAGTQVYEFDVDSLQSDIAIEGTEITGTLKHVAGFTGRELLGSFFDRK